MPKNWQKWDFEKDWAGLIDRRQTLDHPIVAASIAKNVEFYGGTPAKRLGSQYVNGWGVVCDSDWTNSVNAEGSVDDASGLVVAEDLTFYFPDGTSETKTISGKASNVVTLTGTFTYGAPPDGTPATSRRACGSDARIDGLFQANFRNGDRKLLAAAVPDIFLLPALGAGGSPAAVAEDFPATTVDVNWGGLLTGTLTSIETLLDGTNDNNADRLVIYSGAGPTTRHPGTDFLTLDTINNKVTRNITVSAGCTSNPQAGDVVVIYPPRSQGDTHFVQHANQTHIVSDTPTPGDNPPVKYLDVSGTYKLQRHGLRPPTHSDAAPSGGERGITGNVLPGTYQYVFKGYNSATGQESDAGPVLTVTVLDGHPTGDQVRFVNLEPSIDPQTDKKRVYRTTVGGAGVFYYLDEFANSATGYDDNTADTGLGAQMRDFLDTTIPNEIGIITLWPQANRLIGINTSTGAIVFTDQIDLAAARIKPESWPADNFFFVNYDDGDKPRAVVAFYDSVMVFKERSSFRIKGIPPNITIEPVIFRQDLTGVGAFNQKGIVVDQNEMIFPSEDGVYQINRYEGDQAGFESRRTSRQIDNWWDDVNYAYVKQAHGVFFRERRQYRLFLPRGDDDEPKDCIVYQFEGNIAGQAYGWTSWEMSDSLDGGVEITASCVGRGEPDKHYIGTNNGDVIQLDYGYAERGAFVIDFDYSTVWFSPAGKGMPARGRALDFVMTVVEDSTINIYAEADFGDDLALITAVLTAAQGFILGTSQLDVDAFGFGLLEKKARAILSALGEYHRIRFVESSNRGNFRIQNWTYWFQALPAQVKAVTYVQDRSAM